MAGPTFGAPPPTFGYRDPTQQPPKMDGGNWKWDVAKGIWEFVKGNAGDILQTGSGLIEGYMSSQDRAKQLAELARQYDQNFKQRQSEYDRDLADRGAARTQSQGQFDRTTGNTEAQLAVRAQTQLNAAPMADKAQSLLLSRMGVAPGAFKPRDYTQGTDELQRTSVAPGANVANAMQGAGASYREGDGGVDTSTTKWLLDRMRHSADSRGGPTAMPAPVVDPLRPPIPPGTKPRRDIELADPLLRRMIP